MTREPISTFHQAVAFLTGLVRADPRPYQARAALAQLPVGALLARLGDPHVGLPVVHIAGSKGKGSTALYLEAILQAAGLRTGTFTSPHLQRWTERFRIDGRESTESEFAALLAGLQPHVHSLSAGEQDTAPSFFDVLTAAALALFAEQRVDWAIIETGIGGRLDATNVVQPTLACVTSIELEHTDKLGTSISAIAEEKAGIIKKGVPVVIGLLPGEAESLIRHRAGALGAPVSALGREIFLTTRRRADGCLGLRVIEDSGECTATLHAGASQCNARNAALAIACARRVAGQPDEALGAAIERGLAGARLPGRMELIGEKPWVVIDGAHTPASTRALAEMLKHLPARRMHLVVSLSAARDAGTVLAPLLEGAHRVVVTSADASRSLDSGKLADHLVAGGFPAGRVRSIADPREAVLEARAELTPRDLLCVAGSMYMAGVAREMLLDAATGPRRAP